MICSKCKLIKSESDFCKNRARKSGYENQCKACRHRFYLENKTRIDFRNISYYRKNKNTIDIQKRIYNEMHKEKNKNYKREYYLKNRENILKNKKEYGVCNRKRISERLLNRYKTDINFRILTSCRNRIKLAVKQQTTYKHSKTMFLIGCTPKELRTHLEAQFKEGMSWANYGFFGWHIDHIKPCSSFDLSKPEEQQKCFHYTNLQPLWAVENIQKSDKLVI